jgi:hypothetical protein
VTLLNGYNVNSTSSDRYLNTNKIKINLNELNLSIS